MALFIRKSFSIGPFRFNLSKSGVGVSVGVKGLRVGTRPDGKSYVAGGRGGLYFRENLDGKVAPTALPKMSMSAPSTAGRSDPLFGEAQKLIEGKAFESHSAAVAFLRERLPISTFSRASCLADALGLPPQRLAENASSDEPEPENVVSGLVRLVLGVVAGLVVLAVVLVIYGMIERARIGRPAREYPGGAAGVVVFPTFAPTVAADPAPPSDDEPAPAPVVSSNTDGAREWTMPGGAGSIKTGKKRTPAPMVTP
jgi:Protein of unknown function (DUF4236)